MEKATEGHFTATVKAAGGDGPGTFEAVLSMPTLDRDGEIVDKDCFAPLPERITIDVDHGMSVASTVGSGTPFYDGDTLKFSGTFASTPLGQTVRTLVKEGHIDRMSVAYRAAQYEKGEDGVDHLKSAELLNAAIVAIPANRDAVIFAAKEAKLGARNSTADLARLQSAHDLFVELGAECTTKHTAADHTKADTLEPGALLVGEFGPEIIASSLDVLTTDIAPEDAAATAAALSPAALNVALALAELCLVEASLASPDAP